MNEINWEINGLTGTSLRLVPAGPIYRAHRDERSNVEFLFPDYFVHVR
jgi:hypothetical protein